MIVKLKTLDEPSSQAKGKRFTVVSPLGANACNRPKGRLDDCSATGGNFGQLPVYLVSHPTSHIKHLNSSRKWLPDITVLA